MVAHTFQLRRLKKEDRVLKASLGYLAGLFLKKENKQANTPKKQNPTTIAKTTQ